MNKQERRNIIEKLARNRGMVRARKFTKKTNEVEFVGAINPTEDDVKDELVRFDSFNGKSSDETEI